MPELTILIGVAVLAAAATATVLVLLGRRIDRRALELELRIGEFGNKEPAAAPREPVRDIVASEERLAGRIDALAARAEEIADSVAALAAKAPKEVKVAEEVGPILRETLETVMAKLGRLEAVIRESRVETSTDSVARALAAAGFSDVTILGDPVREGDRTRASVEARRDGMTYKGSVYLVGTEVVDRELTPSYPMFP